MHCPYCPNIEVKMSHKNSDGSEWFCDKCQTGFLVRSPKRIAEIINIVNFIRAGKKIDAIKSYRYLFGVDLKTAKDSVEEIMEGIKAPEVPF